MIANYKEKREELNDLLYEMDVPRELFHNFTELNYFIANFKAEQPNAQQALDIIQEISPMVLTKYKIAK
jgi:hypothetical protein